MRNINSASYFEQMKARGCRIVSSDDLQGVTPPNLYGGLPRPAKNTALEGRATPYARPPTLETERDHLAPHRDRRTRKTLYRELDDDLTYTANQLDLDLGVRPALFSLLRNGLRCPATLAGRVTPVTSTGEHHPAMFRSISACSASHGSASMSPARMACSICFSHRHSYPRGFP